MEPQTLEDTSTAEAPGQTTPAPPPITAPPIAVAHDMPTPAPRVRRKDADSLANRFTYHPPFGDQPQRYISMRSWAKVWAEAVERDVLPSRERSLALTKIEEAVFWANAAIARHEVEPATTNTTASDQ